MQVYHMCHIKLGTVLVTASDMADQVATLVTASDMADQVATLVTVPNFRLPKLGYMESLINLSLFLSLCDYHSCCGLPRK